MVTQLSLRDYRSYARLELSLAPGLVLAVGANGAGKTNLLESLHVATQGFSPRTRHDAQLIRFGQTGARVAVEGEHTGVAVSAEVTLRLGEAKRARVNGAALRAAEELRTRLPTLVFTPDRLVVVKGGPAVRRAYFDRSLGRLLPARAAVPTDYAA
ncbi:MAG: AAA family ATPase, partial [Actinomycetota bacterium]|nr:AAA family ATPase [Actinomycetota bacterium]